MPRGYDTSGEALHTIRYGRMPQGDPALLCAAMAGDVHVLLRKGSQNSWWVSLLGAAHRCTHVGTPPRDRRRRALARDLDECGLVWTRATPNPGGRRGRSRTSDPRI